MSDYYRCRTAPYGRRGKPLLYSFFGDAGRKDLTQRPSQRIRVMRPVKSWFTRADINCHQTRGMRLWDSDTKKPIRSWPS
ncbi:MAG: hypothetical protein EOP83_01155 [Verrucomicrobiaceae bacterium]|nr:MAG: hypothetical protein EOP83_01155 [Verrucomicrobiaceae bacterium]